MKVRNDFLKKVVKFGSLDTRMYRYRFRKVYALDYQYGIIERAFLDDLCFDPDGSWIVVARTFDGEHFIHV